MHARPRFCPSYEHLTELLKPFLQNRSVELGWCYSNLDEINKHGEVVQRRVLDSTQDRHPKQDLFTCLSYDMFILPSASLVSRRAFLSVGGFDERLSGYEDDDLFLRMFIAGFDNVYLPTPLSQWRIYQTSSSYSPRMAVSRATYARKLIGRFPNDPDTARYYVRDMIAPRFYALMATELRKVILKGPKEEQIGALTNLAFISGHLRLSHRLPIQLLFLPSMRCPPLARWIMQNRIPLAAILRKLL